MEEDSEDGEDNDGEEEQDATQSLLWIKDGNFEPLDCSAADLETKFTLPFITEHSSPFEVFSYFVSKEELENVCNVNTKYVQQCRDKARQKGEAIPFASYAPFTTTELYRFLALRMATGIIKKPSLKDYWSTKPLHASTFFSETMSRNRFEEIKRSLHFCDNETSDFKSNRMLKLGSLPTFMMERFGTCIQPGRNLCIDESLAKYKGRLSFKQYIPNKRARFGVKLYVIADCSSKFIINIIPYQGETTRFLHDDLKSELGYGGAIVRSLLDPYLNSYRIVFIDNYFNSPGLAQQLSNQSTGVVGTVRSNRKSMPKFGGKLSKGEVEAYTTGSLLVERWLDRREVLMLTNCISHQMLPNKKDKIKLSSVLAYNSCMGAVDELDKSLQPYFAERKCSKWYQKIWLRFVYIAALNSLRVLNSFRIGKKIAFKDFLEDLIQEMIDCNPIEKPSRGRPAIISSAETRLNGHDHFPKKIKKMDAASSKMKSSYLRCILCAAHRKRHETAYECTKCKVRLCVGISDRPCFERYHLVRKVPSKKRTHVETD